MKIVTWNVRAYNSKMVEGLKYILSQKPDILCLQELTKEGVEYLESQEVSLQFTRCLDFSSKHHPERESFIGIYTPHKIEKSAKIDLPGDDTNHSLLAKLLYKPLDLKDQFFANSAVIDIPNEGKVHVQNAHLSTSFPPRLRLSHLKYILENFKRDHLNIVTGDFNTDSGFLFPRLFGWLRSYKIEDYKVSERVQLNEMLKKYKVINPFDGYATCEPKIFKQQFDHIIIPEDITVESKRMDKNFTSEHSILIMEIDTNAKDNK